MDHEDDDTGAVDGSIAPSIESIPLDQEEPQILSEHVQAGAGENGNVSLYNQPPIHTQMRLQLRQCFFDLHFGPNGVPPPLFVLVVQNTGSQMKAIEAAMDALCVAQLSTSTRDHRLGKMAAAHYLVAICHLNREMGRFNLLPAAHRRIDEIIKAIDVLISCSWFGCVEANPKDWIRHMQGMLDIIERQGLATGHPSARVPIYGGWEHNSLLLGLHFQRNTALRPEVPPEVMQNELFRFITETRATEIPALLARANETLRNQQTRHGVSSHRHLIGILTQLNLTISTMKDWQLREISYTPPHHSTVPLTSPEFARFNSLDGVSPAHFRFAYTFSNPEYERTFRLSVLSILKCQQALLAIHRRFPAILHQGGSRLGRDAMDVHLRVHRQAAMATAEAACMLVPLSSKPREMNLGCVDAFRLLHEASQHYRADGDGTEATALDWCSTVRAALVRTHGTDIRFDQ